MAIPAPSIFLVPPYPSSQDDPIYISCTAPKDFLGANFTLFRGEEAVQLLQAPSDQPGVTFNVTGGGSEAAGGNFRCQYGVMGEHSQPQLSDLSQSVQVSFPGKTPCRTPAMMPLSSLGCFGARSNYKYVNLKEEKQPPAHPVLGAGKWCAKARTCLCVLVGNPRKGSSSVIKEEHVEYGREWWAQHTSALHLTEQEPCRPHICVLSLRRSGFALWVWSPRYRLRGS